MDRKIFVYSHIGNSRENHEDNYLVGGQFLSPDQVKTMSRNRKIVFESKTLSENFCVAVSDGMGGHECGEVASFMTVEYLSSHYNELIEHNGNSIEYLNNMISKLNDTVCSEAKRKSETRNMGATLCGLVSNHEGTYCFNVGDSRMYQYSRGVLKQITKDNTEGQRLFDLGLLTKKEVQSFSKRKAIYKYIGKNVLLIPDIYEINDIEDGTLWLLCSDGLSDVIELEEIQDMLSKRFIKTEDKGKFLVEMAVERKLDAGDNVTLIIIEY